jgi:hypothetical protein
VWHPPGHAIGMERIEREREWRGVRKRGNGNGNSDEEQHHWLIPDP